jgi:hypothetical protein
LHSWGDWIIDEALVLVDEMGVMPTISQATGTVFVRRPCRTNDVRALLGEQSCDFLADTPTGACNNGDAPVQLAHAARSILVEQ